MKCKYKKFLKAAYINYDEDYCGHGSGTFTKPTVTTPIIVITGTTAIIACAISGATIYYTLDGSTPTSSSTLYTGTITLTLNCTIKAIAVKPGMSDSEVASESYVHYLTAWRLVGNSSVHTDEYLTSWKVSGNSVVDNNVILSCGDLGQDGKYHIKISNGVNIFDIPLDEPLRKVNDVADTIEFPSNAEGKALVTRCIFAIGIDNKMYSQTNAKNQTRWVLRRDGKSSPNDKISNIISNKYPTSTADMTWLSNETGIALDSRSYVVLFDSDYIEPTDKEALIAANADTIILYELATPTTELIDVSSFPVSPTDTYTSANVVPFSAFEHTENKEIWSCGEYNPTDGKYHILVQPLGGSIADIALTEPLRKVNNVADSIEFPSGTDGKATVTRNLKEVGMATFSWRRALSGVSGTYRFMTKVKDAYAYISTELLKTINTGGYENVRGNDTYYHTSEERMIGMYDESETSTYPSLAVYDPNYNQADDLSAFLTYISDKRMIYRLSTPTTELVDAPQIEEADSYTCVTVPGSKALSWSSFSTE